MLYDQGGRGRPLPMPQRPQPAYQPPQMGFKDALAARANKIRSSMGGTQPFEFQPYQDQQMGTAYGGQSYGQQQPPMYGQQQQQPYSFGNAYGAMGGLGGGMGRGYRRRPPMYQRDINGRVPGAWGYQQPQQYNRPPMQLY